MNHHSLQVLSSDNVHLLGDFPDSMSLAEACFWHSMNNVVTIGAPASSAAARPAQRHARWPCRAASSRPLTAQRCAGSGTLVPGTSAACLLTTLEHFAGILLSSLLLGLIVAKGAPRCSAPLPDAQAVPQSLSPEHQPKQLHLASLHLCASVYLASATVQLLKLSALRQGALQPPCPPAGWSSPTCCW